MPRLVNPADARLFCGVLERFIDAGEIVEITTADARALEQRGTVFLLLPDPAEPKRTAAAADDSAAAAVPGREVKKRGAKRVETTTKPAVETREG